MGGLDWRPLHGINRGRFGEGRLQAHYAVQFLARAARAFIPPLPDDGHTNMGWDGRLGGFTTHRLKGELRVGLRIADLTLTLLGDGARSAQAFPLNGRTDAQARAWLGEILAVLGFDVSRLDAPAPYEMPAYAISGGAVYDTAGIADALAELVSWFANADLSLGFIRDEMIARKFTVSPLRCWPHHFDLAALIALDPGPDGKARSVNAGLSPGDVYYDEPYFYVSPYPYPGAAALPNLPKLGHWHTRDFTAAVATAGQVLAAKDRRAETESFLRVAVEASIKALG
jgi:hypothetical protein